MAQRVEEDDASFRRALGQAEKRAARAEDQLAAAETDKPAATRAVRRLS